MPSPEEPGGHSEYEDMAVAHVLGGLDEDQGRVFRAHLLECPHCRARVGELRAIASDLAGVERNARREEHREEAEGRLDTKERAERERDEVPTLDAPAQPALWPRVALGALLVVVIALSAYVFMLRGQVAQLEQELVDRGTASAVLEHGSEVPLSYLDTEVSATVAMDGRDVAVIVDDLDDDATHQLVLVDDDGDRRAVPAASTDGRLFMLVRREPGDVRLRVERGEGELVVEAELTG
jgi:anti-sigma factor RsiW